jgi:formylglycine-generating enzyme required for sulfatase activity
MFKKLKITVGEHKIMNQSIVNHHQSRKLYLLPTLRLLIILSVTLSTSLFLSKPLYSAPREDKKPPKIKILSPAPNLTVSGPLKVSTAVSDNVGIQKVGFYVDGELVEEIYNPPWEYILNVGFWADGKIHQLKAIATDNSENSTSTEEIPVTILDSAANSPYLLYPRDKVVIQDRNQIRLKWRALYGADNYRVAIAKDRDFSHIFKAYTVKDTTLLTDPLPIGIYYWAVVAKNPADAWSIWSVFHEFSIEPPASPNLIAPKDKFFYKSNESPYLSWNKSKYASQYEIKVVKVTNPDFVEFTRIIPDTFAIVSGLPEEWHLWSVRPINSGGIIGEWTGTCLFYTCNPEVTQFVKVAAGEYTAGKENIIQKIEYDFEIMKYPVTCRQYLNFLNQTYCRNLVDENGYGHYKGDEFKPAGEYKWIEIKEKKKEIGDILFDSEKKYFVLESDEYLDHPIGDVSWFGANAFAEWYGLRLPTEEEWEKTARGKTGFDFPWGNEVDCHNANIAGCIERGFSASTSSVGKFNGTNNTVDSPSPYGAYDLVGNVWEWTNSWFGGNFQAYKVIKGGSYHESKGIKANLESLSTWYRYWMDPQSTNGKYGSAIGFRCVLKK